MKELFGINRLNIEGDEMEFSVVLNPNHAVFKGHFPSYPVLPGVLILQCFVDCLEDALAEKLALKHVTEAKFLKVVEPGKSLDLIVKLKPSNKAPLSYSGVLIYANEIAAKVVFTVRKK